MNKKDIISMAQEANLPACHLTHPKALERFAKLVADHVYAQYLEQPIPNQTGVISITIPEPVAYLCQNAVGHKYFRWKKPSSVYKPIALYTKEQA